MDGKKFAVIGHPIAHTMSPFIHSRLFAAAGINASYSVLDLPPQDLSVRLETLRDLSGFNATIPHKQTIIPLLDSVDPKAAKFGSVNTVKNEDGRLCGFTTDGEGFTQALRAAGVGLSGHTAVLGAGGAARAVAFECVLAGGEVTVAARPHSLPAAERLAEDLRRLVPGARVSSCRISEIPGPIDLLVNATPAGMYPETDACPAYSETIAGARCVFDAVYNPGETELLRRARALGIRTVGGMGMLVRQAAAAQKLWFGADFSEDCLAALEQSAQFEMKKKFGNIVLCGFMGSGKTTVGKLLAARTGRRFVDTDDAVTEREGMSVTDIFAKHGEAYFRAREAEAVRELSLQSGLIVAAGGGTLLNAENARTFGANGVIVLLGASLAAVSSRLRGDASRPLLQRPDREEAMRALYEKRLPVYRAAAEFEVPADGTPEETADAVKNALRSEV